MENQIPVFAKKLWNVVRILFFMLRKGKRKLFVDLNVMLKRGKIAGKALRKLVVNHHSHHSDATFTSNPATGIFEFSEPPSGEYEFSCTTTPAHDNFLHSRVIPSLHLITSRKGKGHYKAQFESIEKEMEPVNHALETMALDDVVSASPVLLGPSFGRRPTVREIRVTDSPFPVSSGGDGDCRVDKAAEEFIKRFYSQLRRQLTDG